MKVIGLFYTFTQKHFKCFNLRLIWWQMLFASGFYSIKVLLFVSGGAVVVGCGEVGYLVAPCNTVSCALLTPFLQTAHVAMTNDTHEPK